MSFTDPPEDTRRVRLLCVSPVAWVLLALAAGTASWLAMAASLFWSDVLP